MYICTNIRKYFTNMRIIFFKNCLIKLLFFKVVSYIAGQNDSISYHFNSFFFSKLMQFICIIHTYLYKVCLS